MTSWTGSRTWSVDSRILRIEPMQQLLHEYIKSLTSLPDVSARLHSGHGSNVRPNLDAQLDLTVAGKAFTLLVEAKKSVNPRDAQQAVWQLRKLSQELNPVMNSVLVK